MAPKIWLVAFSSLHDKEPSIYPFTDTQNYTTTGLRCGEGDLSRAQVVRSTGKGIIGAGNKDEQVCSLHFPKVTTAGESLAMEYLDTYDSTYESRVGRNRERFSPRADQQQYQQHSPENTVRDALAWYRWSNIFFLLLLVVTALNLILILANQFEQWYLSRLSRKDGSIQASGAYTRKQFLLELVLAICLLPLRIAGWSLNILLLILQWSFGSVVIEPLFTTTHRMIGDLQYFYELWINSAMYLRLWNLYHHVTNVVFLFKWSITLALTAALINGLRAALTSPEIVVLPRPGKTTYFPRNGYTDFNPQNTAARTNNANYITSTIYESTGCAEPTDPYTTRCSTSHIIDTIMIGTTESAAYDSTTGRAYHVPTSELPKAKVLHEDEGEIRPVVGTFDSKSEQPEAISTFSDPTTSKLPTIPPHNYKVGRYDSDWDVVSYSVKRASERSSILPEKARSRSSWISSMIPSALSSMFPGRYSDQFTPEKTLCQSGPTPGPEISDEGKKAYWSSCADQLMSTQLKDRAKSGLNSVPKRTTIHQTASQEGTLDSSPQYTTSRKNDATTTPTSSESWTRKMASFIHGQSPVLNTEDYRYADEQPQNPETSCLKRKLDLAVQRLQDAIVRKTSSMVSDFDAKYSGASSRISSGINAIGPRFDKALRLKDEAETAVYAAMNAAKSAPAEQLASLRQKAEVAINALNDATSYVISKAGAAYSGSTKQVMSLRQKAVGLVDLIVDPVSKGNFERPTILRQVQTAVGDLLGAASALSLEAGTKFWGDTRQAISLREDAETAIYNAAIASREESAEKARELKREAIETLHKFLQHIYADSGIGTPPLDPKAKNLFPPMTKEIDHSAWLKWWQGKAESASAKLPTGPPAPTLTPGRTTKESWSEWYTSRWDGAYSRLSARESSRSERSKAKASARASNLSSSNKAAKPTEAAVPETQEIPTPSLFTARPTVPLEVVDLTRQPTESTLATKTGFWNIFTNKLRSTSTDIPTTHHRSGNSKKTGNIVTNEKEPFTEALSEQTSNPPPLVSATTKKKTTRREPETGSWFKKASTASGVTTISTVTDTPSVESTLVKEVQAAETKAEVVEDVAVDKNGDISIDTDKLIPGVTDGEIPILGHILPDTPFGEEGHTLPEDSEPIMKPKDNSDQKANEAVQPDDTVPEDGRDKIRTILELEIDDLPPSVASALAASAEGHEEWEYELSGRRLISGRGIWTSFSRPSKKIERARAEDGPTGSEGADGEGEIKFCKSCNQEHCCVWDDEGKEHRLF